MNEDDIALMRMLIKHVVDADDERLLDPDGHFAFTIVGFVRPDTPDEWVECSSRADRKAAVGSVCFTLGAAADNQPRTVEQLCASALQQFTSQQLTTLITEAQAAVRKREDLLDD